MSAALQLAALLPRLNSERSLGPEFKVQARGAVVAAIGALAAAPGAALSVQQTPQQTLQGIVISLRRSGVSNRDLVDWFNNALEGDTQ